jgi:hypothetical protein
VITISAAILSLSLSQQPAPAILDQRFLPAFGLVTISADESRVNVRMEKDGSRNDRSFDIAGAVPAARITEARCGSWLGEEIAIVLAIRQGETTSYRVALSAFGRLKGIDYRGTPESSFVDPERLWFLTNPIFTSTGEPFRIVAVNDHTGGSDAFELTFRRGWIKRIEEAAKIEEKILFNSCGGHFADLRDRSVLLERGGTGR